MEDQKYFEERKSKNSRVCYVKIRYKDDLRIIGIRDASNNTDDKVISGVLLFLNGKEMTITFPLLEK